MIPGWPYSFVAALESGRTSWTQVLDAVRLGPTDDATAVTADQLCGVVGRLVEEGHWRDGDPPILIVADTGYNIARLTYILADLPIVLPGRNLLRPDATPGEATPAVGATGRPPKHGPEFRLDDPDTWPTPQHHTTTATLRCGTANARGRDRPHPRLTRRTCWIDHDGDLPVIEGTLIRLQVERLPGDRDPKPVWLWCSQVGANAAHGGSLVAVVPAPLRP